VHARAKGEWRIQNNSRVNLGFFRLGGRDAINCYFKDHDGWRSKCKAFPVVSICAYLRRSVGSFSITKLTIDMCAFSKTAVSLPDRGVAAQGQDDSIVWRWKHGLPNVEARSVLTHLCSVYLSEEASRAKICVSRCRLCERPAYELDMCTEVICIKLERPPDKMAGLSKVHP
jgi:hypothetical protein